MQGKNILRSVIDRSEIDRSWSGNLALREEGTSKLKQPLFVPVTEGKMTLSQTLYVNLGE